MEFINTVFDLDIEFRDERSGKLFGEFNFTLKSETLKVSASSEVQRTSTV